METISAVLKAVRACGMTTGQMGCARVREDRRLVLVRVFLLGLLLPICFQGCAVPRLGPRPSATRDHAFIKYWPADGETGKLRLAVKDNIDMKGEVTTAGSQYVAGRNRPAVRDASCLGPARRGNVHIVGKTNLTEFALGTSGMNEYYGTPVNPLAHHRIPGG
ncbi:MAG TPA: amidase family protein, partial [Chthoniobacterales bacterium]|nr:amidase family protein [Chthoniobacterales bacterium]